MFSFFNRSAGRYPTIQEALASTGLQSATDPTRLVVLKKQGSYAGRHVNYFRAYDPTSATAQHVQIHGFGDLDAHRDLILASGHVEHEGLVMVNGRSEPEGAPPLRARADRGVHADDERFVNRSAELAEAAAAALP